MREEVEYYVRVGCWPGNNLIYRSVPNIISVYIILLTYTYINSIHVAMFFFLTQF